MYFLCLTQHIFVYKYLISKETALRTFYIPAHHFQIYIALFLDWVVPDSERKIMISQHLEIFKECNSKRYLKYTFINIT